MPLTESNAQELEIARPERPIPPSLEEFGFSSTLEILRAKQNLERDVVTAIVLAAIAAVGIYQTSPHQDLYSLLFWIYGCPAFLALTLKHCWYPNELVRYGEYREAVRKFEGQRKIYQAELSAYDEQLNIWKDKKREYNAQLRLAAIRKAAAEKEVFWRNLTGIQFENEMAALFEKMGYQVEKTPGTNDGGVDLLIKKDGATTVVQCKAHQRAITPNVARELVGAMEHEKAKTGLACSGIIACFKGITPATKSWLEGKDVQVLCLSNIINLRKKYE